MFKYRAVTGSNPVGRNEEDSFLVCGVRSHVLRGIPIQMPISFYAKYPFLFMPLFDQVDVLARQFFCQYSITITLCSCKWSCKTGEERIGVQTLVGAGKGEGSTKAHARHYPPPVLLFCHIGGQILFFCQLFNIPNVVCEDAHKDLVCFMACVGRLGVLWAV